MAILTLWIKDKKLETHPTNKGDFYLFLFFFLPFFFINVVSLLWSWSILDTLKEINVLMWVVGTVYLFYLTENKETVLKTIVIASAMVAIYAILQSKVLFPKLIESFEGERYAEIVKGQSIPFASFLYHNVFGGYMCFILPLAVFFGFYKKRYLFQFISMFIIAGIILSTSRISMVIAGVFLFIILIFLLKRKEIKMLVYMLLTVLTGILLVVMLLKTGKINEFKGLTTELSKKAQITKEEVKTLNTRTEIWHNALNAFFASPVIGFGAGASEYAYRKYFDGGIYTRYTHSLILKILVETGLIGFLCFILYLLCFFYYLKKRLKEPVYLFIFAAILCGFLFGLFDFSFDMPAHALTFFMLSSVVFENGKRFHSFNKKVTKRLTIIFIIFMFLASFIFTTKECFAQKSIENGNAFRENGFFTEAIQCYKEAIYEMPLNNEGYIGLASLLKQFYQAEKDVQKKEKIKDSLVEILKIMEKSKDRDAQLYFIAGLCHEDLNDDKKAEEYILKAISYYPSSAQYLSEIVRFYLIRNELNKAAFWIESAERYFERYRSSKNPVGFYVFKIKDMKAEIEFRKGNNSNALSIIIDNLDDIFKNKYLISNIKSGINIPKDRMIEYLKGRALRFKQNIN